MTRSVVLAAVWIAMLGRVAACADEPQPEAAKPPNERLLQGADAKLAAELSSKIAEAAEADQYDAGIEHAEELLALRTRLQRADHWETVDARWGVDTLRRVAARAAEEREAWRAALRAGAKSRELHQRARYADALPLVEELLNNCREVLGEEHPLTAMSYNSVAVILQELGKYGEAQPLYQKAMEIRRKVLGEEHPDTALSCNNVAQSLNAQGKYAEAQPLCQKALEIRRRLLGDEHPDTAASYNNLALNFQGQAKYVEAQPLFEKALEICRKAVGEEHPDTVPSYNSLALNLQGQAKYVEAQPLFEKALEIYRKAVGEEHPNTATCYNNVALNLNYQGNYAEAQALHQKALEIQREVLGEMHPDTAISYINVAENLNAQGKYVEAQPLSKKALEICRQSLGEEHHLTATCYNSVATNLGSQGKYAEAEPHLHKALEIFRHSLGEEHHLTATCYNNVAHNLNAQAKYAEAQPFFEKALQIQRKILGEQHPGTGTSYTNVAGNLDSQAKYAEAEPLVQKALEIFRHSLGEEHHLTATCYNNVANNLSAQAKYAEAQPLFEKALQIRCKILGEQHPDTAGSYFNVASNLHEQGKYDLAREVLIAATAAYEAARLHVGGHGLDRAIFGMERSPYRLQAAVEAREGRAREALQALEFDVARGLLDEDAGLRRAALTPAEARERVELLAQLDEIEPRILALVSRPKSGKSDQPAGEAAQTQLTELLQRREVVERRLSDLAVSLIRREISAVHELQSALPPDAAIVTWVDVSNNDGAHPEHWGCVLRATGEPAWIPLSGTGAESLWTVDDGSLPRRFREALTEGAPGERVQALADELNRQRLEPLAECLKSLRLLFVIGTNDMAGIPIDVLTDEFTISYVPSCTFLVRLGDRPPASYGGLLAVGDPVFTRADFEAKPEPTSELPPRGLLITQVVPGGAADQARVRSGDVIVRYGETELNSVEQLAAAMQAQADAMEVPITIWRVGEKQPFTRNVAPGKLGVALSKEPAREAIANRRKTDAMLFALRRGGNWDELPGTRAEVTQLAGLFGPQVTTLVDSAASEQALEELRNDDDGGLSQFRYVHFATHGEANDVRAFESALILAQDTLPADPLPRAGEPFINGQLSANEVLEFWNLNADLVTLSACESALGRQGGGDGLLGFAQAFLKAGSRAVCLSLWKVDDTATALLMTRFYQNLLGKREGLEGPMGKAAALAEAKAWLRELSADEALTLTAAATNGVVRGSRAKGQALKLIVPEVDFTDPAAKDAKPFAHPRFWSAFILIGDPN